MANSNCECKDLELVEMGKVEKDCPHIAKFVCRDCGKFKRWVGRKEYNEWKNLKILEEKKKQQPQPPLFIGDNDDNNKNSLTQLYYTSNKVVEILTCLNKDINNNINNYLDGKFNPCDIKDLIEVINGVFIYHKNEIIKEVEK